MLECSHAMKYLGKYIRLVVHVSIRIQLTDCGRCRSPHWNHWCWIFFERYIELMIYMRIDSRSSSSEPTLITGRFRWDLNYSCACSRHTYIFNPIVSIYAYGDLEHVYQSDALPSDTADTLELWWRVTLFVELLLCVTPKNRETSHLFASKSLVNNPILMIGEPFIRICIISTLTACIVCQCELMNSTVIGIDHK
jgi:hypothetical protein